MTLSREGTSRLLTAHISEITLRVVPGADVNFGKGYAIASDMVCLVYDGPELLAWTDDYGTARHPDVELNPEMAHAVEALVEAAAGIWETDRSR